MAARLYRSLAVALLIAASAHAAEPAKSDELSADLTVEVVGPVVADFPLQLKLTITNTGKTR